MFFTAVVGGCVNVGPLLRAVQENLNAAADVSAEVFIPFKVNSVKGPGRLVGQDALNVHATPRRVLGPLPQAEQTAMFGAELRRR
jgi:hypothetical protein